MILCIWYNEHFSFLPFYSLPLFLLLCLFRHHIICQFYCRACLIISSPGFQQLLIFIVIIPYDMFICLFMTLIHLSIYLSIYPSIYLSITPRWGFSCRNPRHRDRLEWYSHTYSWGKSVGWPVSEGEWRTGWYEVIPVWPERAPCYLVRIRAPENGDLWTVLQVSGGSLWFHSLLNTNNPSYFRTILRPNCNTNQGRAKHQGPGAQVWRASKVILQKTHTEITWFSHSQTVRESPQALDNRGSSETWSAAGGVMVTGW